MSKTKDCNHKWEYYAQSCAYDTEEVICHKCNMTFCSLEELVKELNKKQVGTTLED
jgi:hypothetical protein